MSLVARHLEENGIPTVIIGTARDIVEHCGVARFVFSDFPLGSPCGEPFNSDMQSRIIGAALDLLETLKKPKGRAILLTPGMIELGKEHNPQHKILGTKAANIVNLALVVGPARMASFIDAICSSVPLHSSIFTVSTMPLRFCLIRNVQSKKSSDALILQ